MALEEANRVLASVAGEIVQPVVKSASMPFATKSTDVGVTAGPEQGLQRLIVQVQPVASDEVAFLHRHDGDQILLVLEGEVLMEVDGESRVCRSGEMGVAPASAAHGFRGLGAPALLEIFGEQECGTEFLLRGGEAVEVHRPGVPWDRPGPATDMDTINARALAPQQLVGADPSGSMQSGE